MEKIFHPHGIRMLFVYCLLSTVNCFSQDIHFSQYNFSPLTLNPALTSAYKSIQVTAQYKEQWKMVNAFQTEAITFEMKLDQQKWIKVERLTGIFKKKVAKGIAFGFNVFADKAGDGNLKQTQGNFTIAYHTLLDKNNVLSAGILGGIAQHSINPDGLRWSNQYSGGVYDPNLMSGENFATRNFVYGDFAAGLLWSYGEGTKYISANSQKHVNAGFSVSHLSSPKQTFESVTNDYLKWKYTFHANSLIGITNSNYSIGPSLIVMQQGKQNEVTLGCLIKYILRDDSKYTGYVKGAAFSLGCYYRNKDAIIPFLLIEMSTYSIGLSYDTNISGLTAVTNGRGGFEISLRFSNPPPFLYQNRSRV